MESISSNLNTVSGLMLTAKKLFIQNNFRKNDVLRIINNKRIKYLERDQFLQYSEEEIKANITDMNIMKKSIYYLSDSIKSCDFKFSHSLIQIIRIYLSEDIDLSLKNEVITLLIDNEILFHFIKLISHDKYKYEKLINEIFWVLSNISVFATQKQIEVIIKAGLLEKCVEIIKNEIKLDLIHNALWTLGNFIGDSFEIRNYIISNRIFEQALIWFNSNLIHLDISKDLAFIMKLCSKIKPAPFSYLSIKPIIELSINLLTEFDDAENDLNCIKTLSNIILSNSSNDELSNKILNELNKLKICQLLRKKIILIVKFFPFDSENFHFILPIMKIFLAIATKKEKEFFNNDMISLIFTLIDHQEKEIRIHTFKLLSHLIKQNSNDCLIAFCDSNFILKIQKILMNDSLEIKLTVLICLKNLPFKSNSKYLFETIINSGILSQIIENLDENNEKLILNTFATLEKFLRLGNAYSKFENSNYKDSLSNVCKMNLEIIGAKPLIEKLISHKNIHIQKKAEKIINRFF